MYYVQLCPHAHYYGLSCAQYANDLETCQVCMASRCCEEKCLFLR